MLLDTSLVALSLAIGSLAAPAANGGGATIDPRFEVYSGNASVSSPINVPNTCGKAGSGTEGVTISTKFDVPARCGQYVSIRNSGTGEGNYGKGNTLLLSVTDTCESCVENDIAVPEGAYDLLLLNKSITHPAEPPAQFGVTWYFCDAEGCS